MYKLTLTFADPAEVQHYIAACMEISEKKTTAWQDKIDLLILGETMKKGFTEAEGEQSWSLRHLN